MEIQNERQRLLNSIERFSAIEEKYGITIENIGVKKDEHHLFFYVDVIVDLEDWEYITFLCVLYDSNDNIIDRNDYDIYSNSFVGISNLSFIFSDFSNPNAFKDIKKVRIYPSNVRMIDHFWDDLEDNEEDI